MEYMIVSEHSPENLVRRVNYYFDRGWTVQGGPFHAKDINMFQREYHQAMIKTDEIDETVGPYD